MAIPFSDPACKETSPVFSAGKLSLNINNYKLDRLQTRLLQFLQIDGWQTLHFFQSFDSSRVSIPRIGRQALRGGKEVEPMIGVYGWIWGNWRKPSFGGPSAEKPGVRTDRKWFAQICSMYLYETESLGSLL